MPGVKKNNKKMQKDVTVDEGVGQYKINLDVGICKIFIVGATGEKKAQNSLSSHYQLQLNLA